MRRPTRTEIRLIAAILVAPVIAAAIVAPLVALLLGVPSVYQDCYQPPYDQPCGTPGFASYLKTIAGTAPVGAVMGAMIGWPAMLLVGLPIHSLLMRKTKSHVWTYAGLGIFAGTLAMFAYFAVVGGLVELFMWDMSWIALSGPLTGALAATLFWMIRRPDRRGTAS